MKDEEKQVLIGEYIKKFGKPPLFEYGAFDSPEFFDRIKESVDIGKEMEPSAMDNIPEDAVI